MNNKLLVIIIMAITIFASCQNKEKRLYDKIFGFSNLEQWNSYWEFDSDSISLIGNLVDFQDSIICLPIVFLSSDTIGIIPIPIGETSPEIRTRFEKQADSTRKVTQKRSEESFGIWRIISTDPDSILIEAPNHPLAGRYAVEFFIDEAGCPEVNMPNNIYKFELYNEDRSMILNKAVYISPRVRNSWTK